MFNIDINKIKIAGSQKDVSKTIEELLELNKRIPKRWGEPADGITQKQLDGKDYENSSSRGEREEVTERQFGDREEPDYEILEIRAIETSADNGGHRPEAWDMDEIKIRGHQNVSPLWISVYEAEDERRK